MRITAIDVLAVQERSFEPVHWRSGLPVMGTTVDTWVVVRTDEDVFGVAPAEYWGDTVAQIVTRKVAPQLVGLDPLRREDLFRRMWDIDRLEQLPVYVMGLVDLACWDLLGRLAGLPVWRLAGGYDPRVPAYASTATFAETAEFLDVTDQCLALGFRAIKLHAWGDSRRDAALCLALREHVGPDVDLMYDGSAAFRYADSVYLGRALEEAAYRWYEEPMPEFSLEPYRRLVAQLDIPILGAECTEGAHQTAYEWLAGGACDLIRTGVDFKGGLTGALRIAHVADAFGTTAEVHGGGLPNLHLAAAINNCSYYEAMVLTNPATRDPLVDETGHAVAPEAPGFGFPAEIGT
jgi:L-alanine-DL-glutamate epimerase-like enolase superfamily enzyme